MDKSSSAPVRRSAHHGADASRRQQIHLLAEIGRLQAEGSDTGRSGYCARVSVIRAGYLCGGRTLCDSLPGRHNTGKLVRKIRQQQHGERAQQIASWVNHNYSSMEKLTRSALGWRRCPGSVGRSQPGRISKTLKRSAESAFRCGCRHAACGSEIRIARSAQQKV